jgi:hypothetical protein
MASQFCISRDSVVSLASLHPCQQDAHFLVHTRPPDHCGFFVSADHAETPALCIASFVTNALLSPRALDWIQCLETMTLRRPAPTSVPPTPHKALFDDLCPSITWILRTSVLEWEYLSAEQKQQQTEMREAWLSGYSKPSEAILQHWLWKFLIRPHPPVRSSSQDSGLRSHALPQQRGPRASPLRCRLHGLCG